MKNIFFVNDRESVAVVLSRIAGSFDDHCIVALSPDACYSLDGKNIGYDLLENYTDEIVSDEDKSIWYDKTLKIVECLDRAAQAECPKLRDTDLSPFKNNFYNFYTFYACAARKIKLFDNFILRRHNQADKKYFFVAEESLDAKIFKIIADQRRLSVEFLPVLTLIPKKNIRSRIKEAVRSNSFLKKLYVLRNVLEPLSILTRSKSKDVILSIDFTFDVRFVLGSLLRHGRRVMIWDPRRQIQPIFLPNFFTTTKLLAPPAETLSDSWQKIWQIAVNNPGRKENFVYRDIDLTDMLYIFFKKHFVESVAESIKTYQQAEFMIAKYALKGLLSAGVYDTYAAAVAAAFKKHNLPVIVYQHGGM